MIDYQKLKAEIHDWSIAKGWFDPTAEPRPIESLLMLVVTEVAESVEAYRAGNPACTRPGMEHLTHMAEELADVVIRLVQMADEHGIEIETDRRRRDVSNTDDVLVMHWDIVVLLNSMGLFSDNVSLRVLLDVIEDVAAAMDIDLAEAVRLKMDFNWTRPHKHGKTC